MTPRGHALAALVLRCEADHAYDPAESERLDALARKAEKAAGKAALHEAAVYVYDSRVESEALPLRRAVVGRAA